MTSRDVEAIIQRLRDRPALTADQIDRLYKRLVKTTHPDVAGGEQTVFIQVQEGFEQLRAEFKERENRKALDESIDPYRVLRDVGVQDSANSRQALYVSLYRLRTLGVFRLRMRRRPELRQRNELVIKTVLYWGYEYDTTFVPRFVQLMRHYGNFPFTDQTAKLFFLAKRILMKGLDWAIQFQDNGRPGTRKIAAESLAYVGVLARGHEAKKEFAAILAFAAWLLKELELEPSRPGIGL